MRVFYRFTYRIAFLTIVILFLIFNTISVGQNPIPKSKLNQEDKDKLKRITELMHDSENLQDKAQSISEELNNQPANSNSRNKLRNKALKKDIEAFEKIKEANILKYQIYERHLKKFQKDSNSTDMNVIKARLLEEDANEFFYRASALRSEAYNQSEKFEKKFEKLEKAKNIEQLGFEKMEKALNLYYEKEVREKNNQEPVLSKSQNTNDNVVINEKLLLNIKKTLNRIPDRNLIREFQEIKVSDTISGSKLVDLWYSYLYKQAGSEIPSAEKTNQKKSIPDLAETTSIGEKKKNGVSKDDQTGKETEPTSEPNTKEDFAKDRTYRVQIASDKRPLSQATLRKLYNGDKNIKQVIESGWYKYSVGDFSTFKEAEKFKNSLNTQDAFIVAKDNNIEKPPAEKSQNNSTVKTKKPESKSSFSSPGTISFKVQIAASHVPLTGDEINDIYPGNLDIEQNKVDEWYKYSVGDFNSFDQANNLRKQVPVEGAFVTAYKDGKLIDIHNAVNKDQAKKTVSSSNLLSSSSIQGITFKVQIAADRIAINDSKLNSIYTGIKKVEMNKGEGWYRYSIGNCPTFYHAERLKNNLNVKGAFVVAYKDGQRLNAYKIRNKAANCQEVQIIEGPVNETNIVFAVQIAASINKLSKNDLQNIYCGGNTLNEYREDQWFKYSVGSFSNYSEANELKRSLCVPGAFVVAFKNGNKISVKQAINEIEE